VPVGRVVSAATRASLPQATNHPTTDARARADDLFAELARSTDAEDHPGFAIA
jgi:hypothetical protein